MRVILYGRAVPRVHLGEGRRQQPVAAHREQHPRLAEHQDHHDGGQPGQRADRDDRRERKGSPTLRNASASGAVVDSSVYLLHADHDERDRDVEHRADDQRADDAARQVPLRVLRLLGGGRHDVEADEGEEHDRRAGEDAAHPEGASGVNPKQRLDERGGQAAARLAGAAPAG